MALQQQAQDPDCSFPAASHSPVSWTGLSPPCMPSSCPEQAGTSRSPLLQVCNGRGMAGDPAGLQLRPALRPGVGLRRGRGVHLWHWLCLLLFHQFLHALCLPGMLAPSGPLGHPCPAWAGVVSHVSRGVTQQLLLGTSPPAQLPSRAVNWHCTPGEPRMPF